MKRYMTIRMSDMSVWGVPIAMIACNRARHYASEFGGDAVRSLAEDTTPLFESSEYEIYEWAINNMNWKDFDGHQVKLVEAPAMDFEHEFQTGVYGVSD